VTWSDTRRYRGPVPTAAADNGLPVLRRTAARAILLDERGFVLLLRGRDPGEPDSPAWWFTPGGGLRPGEESMTAAKRECWEELGFVPEVLHGPIGRHHTAFAFNGRWLIQDSAFFWARVTRFEPAPQQWTPLEERFILGWRWC